MEKLESVLEPDLLEQINSKILDYSGIYVAKSQLPALSAHIKKQATIRGISPAEFNKGLMPHTPDFDEIINLVTVNETYFFREERQFDYLKNVVFPKFMGKNLTIWTCCCSTGEEPISLLALALSMNINLTIYASDIDDTALANLKRGRYTTYSLRQDGQKYHSLLEPYSTRTETEIHFRKDFLNRIQIFKFNLIQGELSDLPFFENVDIVFMRNVFIYFDKETRTLVTKKIAARLKNEGILFFSMNEIGSIDNTVIPKNLYKINHENVYFFVKDTSGEKPAALATEANRRLKEKEHTQKKEKLRREVEKVKVQKYSEQRKSTEALDQAGLKEKQNADKTSAEVKKTYENVCMEINRGAFEKARVLARSINGTDCKKYSFFMQGYIEYHADNRAEAETLFASAESISPDFWPAFFYHGMVLRDLDRTEQARGCFSKCKKLISGFGSKVPYDFTLDSFSPSYIYSLCETFSGGGEQ